MADLTPLAQRLVEQAAAAFARAYDRTDDEWLSPLQLPENWRVKADPMEWRGEAGVAVVAVLRTLSTLEQDPPYPAPPAHWGHFTAYEFRRLADEIEGETNG